MIYNYRAKPDYATSRPPCACCFTRKASRSRRIPDLSRLHRRRDRIEPGQAEQLVTSFFPVAPEDEWVIVRAIAYSGLPDWRNLLRKVAPRMPGRKVMIDSYLANTLPTLANIPLEEAKPGMFDKLRGVFTKNPSPRTTRG